MPTKSSVHTHLNAHYRCFSSPQLLGLWAERKILTFAWLSYHAALLMWWQLSTLSLSRVCFVSALPGYSAIKRLRHNFSEKLQDNALRHQLPLDLWVFVLPTCQCRLEILNESLYVLKELWWSCAWSVLLGCLSVCIWLNLCPASNIVLPRECRLIGPRPCVISPIIILSKSLLRSSREAYCARNQSDRFSLTYYTGAS